MPHHLAKCRDMVFRLVHFAAAPQLQRGEVNEPEDHIAALCEVMRHLIAVQKLALEDQKRFFERWIWPVAPSLCGAIEKSAQISFYRPVACFAFAFFELEHSAFEML